MPGRDEGSAPIAATCSRSENGLETFGIASIPPPVPFTVIEPKSRRRPRIDWLTSIELDLVLVHLHRPPRDIAGAIDDAADA